jgi:hypothetical protein
LPILERSDQYLDADEGMRPTAQIDAPRNEARSAPGSGRFLQRWLPPWTSERVVARQTDELLATIDPTQYVGAKHHVVPRFILKRFANAKDQVLVRDRATGERRLSNIKALAVTDFYTFIDQVGELNSSYEQMWGVVERAAADILRDHLENQSQSRVHESPST